MRNLLLRLTLCLAAASALYAGDSAPAGGEYVRGLKLLEEKKYEEAIRAFESAMAYEANETDILKYRDSDGRHRHGYYPFYQLGRARFGQALAEELLEVRKDRLLNAVRQTGATLGVAAIGALTALGTVTGSAYALLPPALVCATVGTWFALGTARLRRR